MIVHVEMKSEEFQEFMEWKEEKGQYAKEVGKIHQKVDAIVDKVFFAIEPDPDDEKQCRVADQDHLNELYEMALEW